MSILKDHKTNPQILLTFLKIVNILEQYFSEAYTPLQIVGILIVIFLNFFYDIIWFEQSYWPDILVGIFWFILVPFLVPIQTTFQCSGIVIHSDT